MWSRCRVLTFALLASFAMSVQAASDAPPVWAHGTPPVRQLYDMQHGTWHGQWTELMKPVVTRLSEDDMLAIAAYTSSRMP